MLKMIYLVSVIATVMALPSPETLGRLLLVLSEVNEASSSKRAKKKSSYKVGSLVQAEVCNFSLFNSACCGLVCFYAFTRRLLIAYCFAKLYGAIMSFDCIFIDCSVGLQCSMDVFLLFSWLIEISLIFFLDNLVQITEIKPLELKLHFGIGLRGRIHITEVSYCVSYI